MTLFELLFILTILGSTMFGAVFFSEHGVAAGIAGGVAGFASPLLVRQIFDWIGDFIYSRTLEGRRCAMAEAEFDKKYNHGRTWRSRSIKSKDGSSIIMIRHGMTQPLRCTFYRFLGDSKTPQELTNDEAENYIDVPEIR